MTRVLKWFVYRPRAYAVIALILFPLVAMMEAIVGLHRVVRDLPGEAKEEVQECWSALIDAYKEWPKNIYAVCERERSRYEKEAHDE